VVLAVLDRKWREHLYEMDYLKDGIGLRGMGQRDPLVEYQREGYQMYNSMVEAIKEESIQLLFHLDVQQVQASQAETEAADEAATSASGPADPDDTNDTADEASTAEEVAEAEAGESESKVEADEVRDSETEDSAQEDAADDTATKSGIVGPAPISHENAKVPASRRPKSEELRSPWSDGRTFPGTPKNAPCPCGSGRKYKLCHGRNEK
jgi:preprotein translocase subunit SecA